MTQHDSYDSLLSNPKYDHRIPKGVHKNCLDWTNLLVHHHDQLFYFRVRGPPDMISASEGGGGHGTAD